jgi:hypothetical protein
MPPGRRGGNGGRHGRENHSVHSIAELMDVIRDLCCFAAVFRLVGNAAYAETLIEQCADLLAHRARLLAAPGKTEPRFPRGTPWMN